MTPRGRNGSVARSVLAVTALLLGGCADEGVESEVRSAPPVVSQPVEARSLRPTFRTSGIIASKSASRLSFKIDGIITEIAVEEGDSVAEGAVLAQLDQTDVRARLNQARVAFDKAERDLTRAQKLLEDNVISEEKVSDARSVAEDARNMLQISRDDREGSTIVATAAGVITRRFREANEHVRAGEPVLVLATSVAGQVLRASLTDRDIVQLEIGNPATVTLDAHPDVFFQALVTELPGAANPDTGLYEVELELRQGGLRLLPGMIGHAEIAAGRKAPMPVVPIEALIDADRDRGYVYVLKDGVAERRLVSLGALRANEIFVTEGLEEGDVIVTQGAAYLRDGLAVRNIPE